MKKIIALLLANILCISIFGCSKKADVTNRYYFNEPHTDTPTYRDDVEDHVPVDILEKYGYMAKGSDSDMVTSYVLVNVGNCVRAYLFKNIIAEIKTEDAIYAGHAQGTRHIFINNHILISIKFTNNRFESEILSENVGEIIDLKAHYSNNVTGLLVRMLDGNLKQWIEGKGWIDVESSDKTNVEYVYSDEIWKTCSEIYRKYIELPYPSSITLPEDFIENYKNYADLYTEIADLYVNNPNNHIANIVYPKILKGKDIWEKYGDEVGKSIEDSKKVTQYNSEIQECLSDIQDSFYMVKRIYRNY